MLTYHCGPDFAPLARQHFPGHQARLQAFHQRGDLLAAGSLLDPANGDSLGVFTSETAAQEFASGDPFVLNQVVTSWTVRPWREIFLDRGAGSRS